MAEFHPLSVWPERRPPRDASKRHATAREYAQHLPPFPQIGFISDDDLNAMRAAFIAHFDEPLPRTETLMAVAAIGYRMAVRDFPS